MSCDGQSSLDDVFSKTTVLSDATGVKVLTEEGLATTAVEAVVALKRQE